MKTQFDNCDQFADYLINSVLDQGDLVTAEFNQLTNLDITRGKSLTAWLAEHPQKGENYLKLRTVRSFLYDIFELQKSPLFKYFDTVRLAYYWSSMDPYRSARININEHIQELNSDLSVIPECEHEQFTQGYIKYYLDWISAKSRTASAMVTGPAKFPTERNRKALDLEQRKYESFQNWRERAIKKINMKIERNKPEELKNAEKWESLKLHIIKQATVIIGIDNGTEPYSRALFVSSLVNPIITAAKNGETEIVEKSLSLIEEINKGQKKPVITLRHKVWQLKGKSVAVAYAKDNPRENVEYPIDGGKIIVNYADNRIQVKHDEKPSKQIIDMLKENSFNWSRFNACWQRKITYNTKSAINKMFGVII